MHRRLILFQQYGRDPLYLFQNSLNLNELEWSSEPSMMNALVCDNVKNGQKVLIVKVNWKLTQFEFLISVSSF